jgi:hypothetical protein
LPQRLPQSRQTNTTIRLDGHDWHAEPLSQFGEINNDTLLMGKVAHRQRNHYRPAYVQDLSEQVEITVQIRGIEHAQNYVRCMYALTEAQENLDRNHLVWRTRSQRISAREIYR